MSEYVNFKSVGGANVKAVIYEGCGPVDLTIKMDERAMGISIHKGDAINLARSILVTAGVITIKEAAQITARQDHLGLV